VAKCKMCDFRRKDREKIPLPDALGSIFAGEERQELNSVTGNLELEKSLNPLTYKLTYKLVITVTGMTPDWNTVCTIIKIPVNICPNCGRVLRKGSVNVYVSKE